MPWTSKDATGVWSAVPVDGGVSEMALTRSMVMKGLMLDILYSITLSGAGAAVRARSIPIKRLQVLADGKPIYTIRGVDLVTKAMIFEQTPIAQLLTMSADATAAAHAGLEAHVPVHFRAPHAGNGFITDLPAYAYGSLILRVEWGSASDLFTDGGTLAGTIAFTANGQTVTQLREADLQFARYGVANQRELARRLRVGVDRYVEVTQAAAAQDALELPLGNTSDIARILITSELTSTGEPTNTIIDKISLEENKGTNIIRSVPGKSVQADNGKIYGVTMPTGCYVIDFAEDGDYANIYRARRKDSVSLFFKTLAVAGKIRAHLMTTEPPVAILAATSAA